MRAVPALRAMLEKYSNKPFVRLFAGYGLAMLNDEEGLRVVIDTLNNQGLHWVDRRHAIRALGELRDKQAVPHLIVALKDDHPNIRVSAARALGAIGDASALSALEQALKDKAETKVNAPTTVSKAAAEAIAQIRTEGRKAALQVEDEEAWNKRIQGLDVSITMEKTTFDLDEPIPVTWRIKNVSNEDKTIIWHERNYSPVLFEIGKKGEKKYIPEDSRRMFTGAIPGPPEKIVLKPGDVKEATFDLRYSALQQQSGVYEVTGLYSPKDSRMLSDIYLKKPEFKDIIDTRIDSATIEITLTEDLAWLKNELSTGTFHSRLSAARRLALIIGNKDVLAGLEKIYPAENTREMVWLVDHMAQFGNLSHVPDVLDMYEAGGYAPYWGDYGEDMLVFLLKWGGDRGIAHLTQYLAAHKDTSKGTAECRIKKNFLQALVKGSYWYFDFEISDESLPLLILVLDEKGVQGGMTLESGAKIKLRWCDSAALAVQKMLKQDWDFNLELSEQERDGTINQMRGQLADRIPAISKTEHPVQFKAIDFSHGGGFS